jgi:hypothetical protein
MTVGEVCVGVCDANDGAAREVEVRQTTTRFKRCDEDDSDVGEVTRMITRSERCDQGEAG